MHFNNKLQKTRSVRRSPAVRLREQLVELAGGHGTVAADDLRIVGRVVWKGGRL